MIPTIARADWTAFLEALDAQGAEKATAIAQARRDLSAAATALDKAGGPLKSGSKMRALVYGRGP